MRVLITTSYFWPEGAGSAPYLTGLADHLQERGHDVVVATGYPHYPEWRLPPKAPLARHERFGRAQIRRRWHYVPRTQTAAHRAVYEASLLGLGLTALPLRRRPDVVVGTCPTLAAGVLAATASAIYRAPYVLVFQDLVGQAALQSGVPGGSRVAGPVGALEHRLSRGAAGVGIIAEGFRRYLEQGGVRPERIHRLRNWTRRTPPTETVEETRRRLGWTDDELVCLHGGNLGRKQGLDNLLDAAALLRDRRVRFVFAGDGNDRERLERRASDLGLDNVQFVDLQPPGPWEAVMQASHVLLVNQRPSVTDMSLPSKLTSYFAAGRPIVAAASADSETAREIAAAKGGVVVEPDDPEALRDAILDLKQGTRLTGELGDNARRYAETVLLRENALAEYEQLLTDVAAGRRHG